MTQYPAVLQIAYATASGPAAIRLTGDHHILAGSDFVL